MSAPEEEQEQVVAQAQVEEIKFNTIPEKKLDVGSELTKIQAMGVHLKILAELWNAMAAAEADAVKAAYKALQESKIKIVDISNVDMEKTVFLGGSRKRRQSKKRRNQRKHNNNQ
jgi:hypothetical protein